MTAASRRPARRWHEWNFDWSALQAFMMMQSLLVEVDCGYDAVLVAGVRPSGPSGDHRAEPTT